MDFRQIRSHVMVFISMVVLGYGAKDSGNERFGTLAFQRMSKLWKRFRIRGERASQSSTDFPFDCDYYHRRNANVSGFSLKNRHTNILVSSSYGGGIWSTGWHCILDPIILGEMQQTTNHCRRACPYGSTSRRLDAVDLSMPPAQWVWPAGYIFLLKISVQKNKEGILKNKENKAPQLKKYTR